MMTPCPKSPMSIEKAAWHLSSDEAAGVATFWLLKGKQLELRKRATTKK